jgi:hypothetical protein
MNRARVQYFVLGVLVLVVSVIAFYMTFDMPDIDAYRFPRMVIIVFFTLGTLLLIGTLKGNYDSSDGSAAIKLKDTRNPGISLMMVIGYAILINFTGFYTATVVFMIVFMKFLGAKSWVKILLITVSVNIFIYLLFTLQFRVPLPRGIAM